ncbi:hypothetical protein M8C21_012655, partial [Ambrosia artemisiifolia]
WKYDGRSWVKIQDGTDPFGCTIRKGSNGTVEGLATIVRMEHSCYLFQRRKTLSRLIFFIGPCYLFGGAEGKLLLPFSSSWAFFHNLAKDEYERNFISAVVPPSEIGIKFDDIGALEDVKTSLHELAILPMKRPELFSHGNLLRPCKGILFFGPPGTGKTLLAKALATEAGANFISITGSTLTSKWFADAEKLTKALFSFAEKLTKALFSFASKLAPVIVFVDEVDSLLGARGGGFEREATRRVRNEFMAAWDGLRSKDSQRILILGATNRPFDLDD